MDELRCWFNENLNKPTRFRRSRKPRGCDRGVCWFKSTATQHIAKMYEMRCVLERNDSYVRVITARRPGYIVYEDEYQVVAEPFADLAL